MPTIDFTVILGLPIFILLLLFEVVKSQIFYIKRLRLPILIFINYSILLYMPTIDFTVILGLPIFV
jgi:hypothetical protein